MGLSLATKQELVRLGLAASAGGTYLLFQGPLVRYYRNYKVHGFFGMLSNQQEEPGFLSNKVEISPQLQKLIDEVKEDMSGYDASLMKRVNFMTTNSTKTWIAGAPYLNQTYIAIPDYFNVADIKQLREKPLNDLIESDFSWRVKNSKMWFEGAGKLLITSFLLSDKAKKFLIAREMGKHSTTLRYNQAMYITASVYSYYLCERALEISAKTKLTHMNPLKRLWYACLAMSLATLLYLALTVLGYQYSSEMNGDAFAISFGLKTSKELWNDVDANFPRMIDEDYYEGALEYYNKLIDRNVALREMIKLDSALLSVRFNVFTKEGSACT